MKKYLLLPALILLIGLVLAACGGSQEESAPGGDAAAESAPMEVMEWRFALEEIQGSMQDIYAQEFIANLDKLSGGMIKPVVYYYGELGTSGDITEQLQSGVLELAFQSPGHLGSYVPEVQIFSLHYILPQDQKKIQQLLESSEAINTILAESYRDKDLQLLDIFSEGWQIWSSNKPLRKPADFVGLDFRTMSSSILVEDYQAYGANVLTLPYSDIYSALQLQSLDAQVQPYFAQQEMKFYEVQDYLTNAYQLMFICTLAGSKNWWDGLTPEVQDIVRQAVTDTRVPYSNKMSGVNDERKQMIADAKPEMVFYDLSEAEQAPFKQLAEKVYDTYLEIGGPKAKELLDTLRSEVAALQ